ncbi:MAG: hypothetical protein ACLFR1_01410 [Spirochaetia bacterium]
MTDDYDGAQCYLLDEFLDTSSAFRKWFDNSGAEQVSRIVRQMYSLGLKDRFLFDRGVSGLEPLQAAWEGMPVGESTTPATAEPSGSGITPDDEHVQVRGVQDPRVKKLLPNPAVFSNIGGLMHRVEGEEFLRLPGLLNFGALDYTIEYLTSGKLSPEEVEAAGKSGY